MTLARPPTIRAGQRTSEAGRFELPIAPGEWILQTQTGDRKGDDISLTVVEEQTVDPIILILP